MKRAIAASALVVLVGVAAAWWALRPPGETGATVPTIPRRTAAVTRTDLVETETFEGTLGFVAGDPVVNRLPGTLTGLPEEGATVGFGEVLFRVDDAPVVLFPGDIPMYRPLSTRTPDGRDVEQLEAALVALGYDPEGRVTVDEDFTSRTRSMVEDWQDDLGLDDTGVVELGRVVFLPEPVRVADLLLPVGSPLRGSEAILGTSSEETRVTVQLPAADQELLVVGDSVTVELPDGTPVTGDVVSKGNVARRRPDGTAYFEIEAILADAAPAAGLDEAPVDVIVETDRSEDVLAVPVTALVALIEGGYAVEVVDGNATRLVAVDPGLYADGLVEVSGDGLAEGMRVIVP